MGKNNKTQQHHRKKKHATAITFDENERDNHLKGMFGAKKRRREQKKRYA